MPGWFVGATITNPCRDFPCMPDAFNPAEELFGVVGDEVGKVVDRHLERRPWLRWVFNFLIYGLPALFSLWLLNDVFGWI